MSITPFIRPIKTAGGTLYTVSSAAEDLTQYTLNKGQYGFKFSKFTVLNIPDIRRVYNQSTDKFILNNYIQFDNILGNFEIDGSKSANIYLAESFQNYMLNLETIIRNSENYNTSLKDSHAESVFFKWLKEIGAIRFREANNDELSNSTFGAHFVEEDESSTYKRVVRYIGNFDLSNAVKDQKNVFSEIYAHIPGEHGALPNVLFYTKENDNYKPGLIFSDNSIEIFGRNSNDVHPEGLEINAHYDSLTDQFGGGIASLEKYNEDEDTWSEGTWYPDALPYSYYLEPDTFKDPRNDVFRAFNNSKEIRWKRSRLDGIKTQFNPSVYTEIVNNKNINNFAELAISKFSTNFEFNAILIYYDIYNKEVPDDVNTNLYGVLFLDNVDPTESTGISGSIPRLPKIKPNSITGDNGNSYSFKINIKFDTNIIDSGIQTSINSYNTFSMELFLDAISRMRSLINKYDEANKNFNTLEKTISDIESRILTDDTKEELVERINTIETFIREEAPEIANSAGDLIELINRNYNEIQNILNNNTSIELAYNLNVIRGGAGIDIDRSSNNFITISSDRPCLNLGDNPIISIENDFSISSFRYTYEHQLEKFSNYIKIIDGSAGSPYILDRGLIININDEINKWSKGQTLTISIKWGLDMNNVNGKFNLEIYTGYDETETGFTFSRLIDTFTWEDFQNNNGRPRIEIICIDPENFIFETDIL